MNDDFIQEDPGKETKDELDEDNLSIEKEELESILKAIEELERMKKKEHENKNQPRNLISIEFGSVFHNNLFINFAFNFILNLTLIYLVIEVFQFAKYTNIVYVIVLALIYTFFETIYRTYVLYNHFSFVIKSMGFIFYFGYVVIFYSLDVYVFGETFDFYNETLLIAFVAIFTLIRYIIGTTLIKNFRKRNL